MALGGTYTTGTVSTDAEDAKKLVFSGTLLESVAVEGDWIEANGAIGIIASVDDDTNVTLEQDWTGGTLTDSAYVLIKSSWKRYDPAITQAKIREFIAYIKGQGSFLFVTGATPDPAMGEDGQYALKTNGGPWQLWYKTGGVWEVQSAPVGTVYKGEWSSIGSYIVNDRVSRLGSSYIAKAPSTNQDPATDNDATYWDTSGVKGDPGRDGGVIAIPYIIDLSSTANSNPGAGKIRLGPGASQKAATVWRTVGIDADGNVWTSTISDILAGTSAVKFVARLYKKIDQTKYIIGNVTGTSAAVDYYNLIFTATGGQDNPFTNGDDVVLALDRNGDKGDTGATGATGAKGDAATITIGTVETVDPSDPADVTNSGTSTAAVLNFQIPQGATGETGPQGQGIQPDASGTLAGRAAADEAVAGFKYLQTDVTPFLLYVKMSNTIGDWSEGSPMSGNGDMLNSDNLSGLVDPDTALDNLGAGIAGKEIFAAADDAEAREIIGVRGKIDSNLTLYVRADGSDTNDGLSNTSGGAFLTLQKAWNTAAGLDLNGRTVTIQVGDGTYTAGVDMTSPPVGGLVNFTGNISTPANVVISTTGDDCFNLSCATQVTVKGFKLQTTTSGSGIICSNSGIINFGNVEFGACAIYHMRASTYGSINNFGIGSYSISGNAPNHMWCAPLGSITMTLVTVTLTGTPAFSDAFAHARGGQIVVSSITYTGSATGKRYIIDLGGAINTFGAGTSYLPGDADGEGGGSSGGGYYA